MLKSIRKKDVSKHYTVKVKNFPGAMSQFTLNKTENLLELEPAADNRL